MRDVISGIRKNKGGRKKEERKRKERQELSRVYNAERFDVIGSVSPLRRT